MRADQHVEVRTSDGPQDEGGLPYPERDVAEGLLSRPPCHLGPGEDEPDRHDDGDGAEALDRRPHEGQTMPPPLAVAVC